MRGLQLPRVERRHAPVLTVWKEVVGWRADPHARGEPVLPTPRVEAVRRKADRHVGDERYLARRACELSLQVELGPLMKGDTFGQLAARLLDALGPRRPKR